MNCYNNKAIISSIVTKMRLSKSQWRSQNRTGSFQMKHSRKREYDVSIWSDGSCGTDNITRKPYVSCGAYAKVNCFGNGRNIEFARWLSRGGYTSNDGEIEAIVGSFERIIPRVVARFHHVAVLKRIKIYTDSACAMNHFRNLATRNNFMLNLSNGELSLKPKPNADILTGTTAADIVTFRISTMGGVGDNYIYNICVTIEKVPTKKERGNLIADTLARSVAHKPSRDSSYRSYRQAKSNSGNHTFFTNYF